MVVIRLKCEEYDTALCAQRNLEEFIEFMGYDCDGFIDTLATWRRSDYKYVLKLSLPDVPEFVKIIQGAFNEGEEWLPVHQIKRYLLINTHA